MAEEKAFLLPVAIDGTRDGEALVPAEFKQVQWSRLPGGEVPPAFVAQVQRLLGSPDPVAGGAAIPGIEPHRVREPGRQKTSNRRPVAAIAAGVMLLGLAAFWFTRTPNSDLSSPDAARSVRPGAAPAASAPISEARKLARQAQELIGMGEELNLAAAEVLTARALKLDDTDAEVWAAASSVDASYLNSVGASTPERVRNAQERARRALSIDPNLFEARRAWAHFLIKDRSAGSRVPAANEAEPILQKLRSERPRDPRTLLLLGEAMLLLRRVDDAKAVFASLDAVLGSLGSGGWQFYQNGFFREAEAALDRAIASRPVALDIALKIHFAVAWHGDFDMAAATLARLTEEERRTDQGVSAAVYLYVWSRAPAKLLALLQQFPREWIVWGINGPRDAIVGDALAQLGRSQAATLNWQQALKQVESRLAGSPSNKNLLGWKMYLQNALGDVSGFAQTSQLFAELPGVANTSVFRYELRTRNETEERILGSLETDLNARSYNLFFFPNALRLSPAYDKVRETSRFQALLALAEANARANDLMPPGK